MKALIIGALIVAVVTIDVWFDNWRTRRQERKEQNNVAQHQR